jgi:hypothetical protein
MKIIKHKLSQITDKIFALEIPNDWDRAMTFLRAQEFYESSSNKFRGKGFDVWDYMKWYAEEGPSQTGTFSYHTDWVGFNLPIRAVVDSLDRHTGLLTPYDIFMDEILHQLFNKYVATENNSYLIGVEKMEGITLNHEMSHALWYTEPEYKKRATALIKQMPKDVVESAKSHLKLMGYANRVLLDEITAYASTNDLTRLMNTENKQQVAAGFTHKFVDLLEEFMPAKMSLKKAA